MFGRKETEKRSLEDMFTPRDVLNECIEECEDADECEETFLEDDFCDANNAPIKPLACFGMEEGKTEKWLMKCVKFWFCCMSFMWFLFGATTFAPVIYISNKVNVIFKDKKKSFFCAAGIYGSFVLLVILLIAL